MFFQDVELQDLEFKNEDDDGLEEGAMEGVFPRPWIQDLESNLLIVSQR